MHNDPDFSNRRILLIDDNPAIHQDFRKIFSSGLEGAGGLAQTEAALFGASSEAPTRLNFTLDSALQGEEGLTRVCSALQENRPYAMAFIDVRMPPGWDGIETIQRIWQHDPALQVVICTAYSDYSWEDMLQKLGSNDRLIILKKPFDNVEVLQLANALTEKWSLAQRANCRLEDLERMVEVRTQDLQRANAQLESANRELAAQSRRANDMTEAALAASQAKGLPE